MNNKHHAVWAVIALLIVFLAILVWRMFDPTPRVVAPGGDVATTTPAATPVETLHIKESTVFYDIDAAYPSATPLRESAGAEADAMAVTLMKNFEMNTIEGFKENSGLDTMTAEEFASQTFGRDAKYAMTIEYKVYESPKTISYAYTIYQDTMGAHPNTYYRTFTFDRATGSALEPGDLFVEGAPYLDRLSARTRADLPRIMAKMAETTPDQVDRDYINSGTMPIVDSFGNFVIEGTTLRMIFPPYQVGPYVYGTIEVPIPLSDLRDILDPNYRP